MKSEYYFTELVSQRKWRVFTTRRRMYLLSFTAYRSHGPRSLLDFTRRVYRYWNVDVYLCLEVFRILVNIGLHRQEIDGSIGCSCE